MVSVPTKVEDPNLAKSAGESSKNNDIIVEHEGVEQKEVRTQSDPLSDIHKRLEESERLRKDAESKLISTERERDLERSNSEKTRTALANSEVEKVSAQEASINNRLDAARAAALNARNAWIDAVDSGKSTAEQADLMEAHTAAVYALKGVEGAKAHFDNWKEKQKTAPKQQPVTNSGAVSEAGQKWIDSHPRFNTDRRYRRIAEGAHLEYERTGKSLDTPEYFKFIEEALHEEGLDADGDNSGQKDTQRKASSSSTAAPASFSSAASGGRGSAAAQEERSGKRVFKLDSTMREIAHRTYGKTSSFGLSNEEAERKYAARQLEIQEKRKNGERI